MPPSLLCCPLHQATQPAMTTLQQTTTLRPMTTLTLALALVLTLALVLVRTAEQAQHQGTW